MSTRATPSKSSTRFATGARGSWATRALLWCAWVATTHCGPGAVNTGDAASDGAAAVDLGSDAPDAHQGPCTRNVDCDDGRYCNGPERCLPDDPSADARGCAPATMNACRGDEVCDERAQLCRPGAVVDGGEAGVNECDRDHDGVRAIACGGTDCDDNDPNRFPGNPERCDGSSAFGALAAHDEDCDPCTVAGPLPDGDGDRDGFVAQTCTNTAAIGAPDPTGCNARTVTVEGRTVRGLDCADDDRGRNPDAPEVCNPGGDGRDIDDNCRPDPPGSFRTRVYLDSDGDGYGDPMRSIETATCPIPVGGVVEPMTLNLYVGNANDCDDTRSEVRPGAPEICDGLINNCIARTPGAPIERPEEDRDGDRFTDAATTRALCLAAGETTSARAFPRTDCDDHNAQRNPALTELCDGVDNDCNAATNEEGQQTDCASGVTCSAGRCGWIDDVALRHNTSCVTTRTRETVCWGGDTAQANWLASGRLAGLGSIDEIHTPHSLTEFSNRGARELATGNLCACVIAASGDVYCAGGSARRANIVRGVSNATKLALGNGHACAVLADGSSRCWACGTTTANTAGQLGDGTTVTPPALTSVGVSGAARFRQITAGSQHTCALDAAGTVHCWGSNVLGQLGQGDFITRHTPTPLTLPRPALDVRAHSDTTCARLDDGTVACWGSNDRSQCSATFGMTAAVRSPIRVPGVRDAIELAVGGQHVCVRTAEDAATEGALVCWGSNTFFQLGSNDVAFGPMARTVAGTTHARAIAAGAAHTCALLANGALVCFGSNQQQQTNPRAAMNPRPVERIVIDPPMAQLVATVNHACARRADGRVYCAGTNAEFVLGDPTTAGSRTLRRIPAFSDVTSLAVGYGHACLTRVDGSVWCWGARNNQGMVGVPSPASRDVPSQVATLTNALEVVAGERTSCARLADGTARCWGRIGTLGDGRDSMDRSGGSSAVLLSEPTPREVMGLTGIEQLAASASSVCARLRDGTVWCWGSSDYGQLGDGMATPRVRGTPVQVLRAPASGETGPQPLAEITQVYGGGEHFCAINATRALYCWGRNDSGTLGTGATHSAVALRVGTQAFSHASIAGIASLGVINEMPSSPTNNALVTWGSLASTTVLLRVLAGSEMMGTPATSTGMPSVPGVTYPTLPGRGAMFPYTSIFDIAIGSDSVQRTSLPVTEGTNATALAYLHTGRELVLVAWGNNSAGRAGVNSTAATIVTPTEVVFTE